MIKNIQKEVFDWHVENFGPVPAWKPILIITEEIGELSHAYLKREQKIRMTENHDENIKDAVADIVIGLMAFCSIEGIDLETELLKTWDKVKQRDWKKNPNNAHLV